MLGEGHQVIITSRKKYDFSELKKIFHKNVNFLNGDFSKPKDAQKIIGKGIKILKGLDVLICNVGESKSSPPNKENFQSGKKCLIKISLLQPMLSKLLKKNYREQRFYYLYFFYLW